MIPLNLLRNAQIRVYPNRAPIQDLHDVVRRHIGRKVKPVQDAEHCSQRQILFTEIHTGKPVTGQKAQPWITPGKQCRHLQEYQTAIALMLSADKDYC